MTRDSYEIEEFDELDSFLADKFNHETYLAVEDELAYRSNISPLDFFKLFFRALSFLRANAEKPILVERNLEELVDPTDVAHYLILQRLVAYADYTDELQIKNARAIHHLRYRLEETNKDIEDERITQEGARSPVVLNTKGILSFLHSLPDGTSRQAYLIRKRTEILHAHRNATAYDSHIHESSLRWIDDKLAELEAIEKLMLESDDAPDNKDEYHPTKRGLTRQLAMLLLDELFPNLKGASKTSKAEFLELLTGFGSEGLRQKWADYRRGNPEALAADIEMVRSWKKRLKISDTPKNSN